MLAMQPETQAPIAARFPTIAEPVIKYVLKNFAEAITLDDLAREAGLSRFNFCRRFHKECGQPPMRWLWTFRTALAAEFIALDPKWSLTDVAFACGFTSSAHFSRAFKAMFGQSPSKHRKAASGTQAGASAAGGGFDQLFTNNGHALLRAVSAAMAIPSQE